MATKARKLTQEEFERSRKARGIEHLWLYMRQETTQRTHHNSIFLDKTVGQPYACIVVKEDLRFTDSDLQRIFGQGAFYDGAVSPDDLDNMRFPVYYIS